MVDMGLDTTRRVDSICEVPLGAGVLVHGAVVGVLIDHRCVADGVQVMR